jgi:RNA polymerase sigma-70 factor (ECF subfamily)
MKDLLAAMTETRQRFMDLVAEVRPELHRYCARMTGSVFDGEDVVQETLAKAYYALGEMEPAPPLRPWLFRIAHNTAMDFLRRFERRFVDAVDNMEVVLDMNRFPESEHDPDGERVETALEVFAALPPLQRSALALKDVLGLSLEETAKTMDISIAAVKGALVRARANVAAASASGGSRPEAVDLARLRHYADLFNARNWDGLRALMGEEARVELVSRWQRRGSSAAGYYARYAEVAAAEDLRADVGFADGVPTVAVYRRGSMRPAYFIRVKWEHGRVAEIRDFYFVPYIAEEARFAERHDGSRSP